MESPARKVAGRDEKRETAGVRQEGREAEACDETAKRADAHAVRRASGVSVEVVAPTAQRNELARRNLQKWLQPRGGEPPRWEEGVVSDALMNVILTVSEGEPPVQVAARQASAIAVVVIAPDEAVPMGRCVGDLIVHRLRRAGLESYMVVQGC